jgi:hypothetical protein
MLKNIAVAIMGVAVLATSATAEDKKPKMSDAAITKLAMSAGPADVTKGATIVAMGDDMKARQIKAGTNGWVCMVAMMGPTTDSMCLDKEWQGWADAWMNKKDPQVKGVGVAYMLNGDNGASNTDPYAMAASADNNWVVTGPHVMVLTSDTKLLDAMGTDWKAGGPWVMWKGTKYAHIMVPMGPMPKQPAPPKAPAPKPAK